MAGSMKTVVYVADNGAQYCIKVDESNIELVMGAQVPASGAYPALPKGTEPRKVRLESQIGLVKRVVPVLTLARYGALTGSTPFTIPIGELDGGTDVRVRTKVGEKNRFIPRDYDTGKKDGDDD
jgi:hypothetical protein